MVNLPFFDYLCTKKSIVYFCLALNIILILYFGLNPRIIDWGNTALIDSENNLVLKKGSFAIVHVEPENYDNNLSYDHGFSIEAIIKSYSSSLQSRNIFRILLFDAKSEIYIFQWENKLIASWGKDYNYKRKKPRVSVELKTGWQKIKLDVLNQSMKLYIQGDMVDMVDSPLIQLPRKSDLVLKVGDSSLRRSWNGGVSYLSIASYKDGNMGLQPIFEYDARELAVAVDRHMLNRESNFVIPEYPIFFDRELLVFPGIDIKPSYVSISDIFINIIGFIPSGFLLMLIMVINKKPIIISLFSVFLFGFLLSLLIEYTQSWLPVRSSSGLDLLLNTLGGILGSLCLLFLKHRRDH
ncbi:MAG: VanZ family protein [Cellvibrionaceae bacterium]